MKFNASAKIKNLPMNMNQKRKIQIAVVWVSLLCIVLLGVMVYADVSCRMVPVPDYCIYVIHMSSKTRRWASFSRRIRECDLDHQKMLVFEGVDGNAVSLSQHLTSKALQEVLRNERMKFRQKHYELTRGAVGCFLSHVSVWRDFLNGPYDAALVLEDDAVPQQFVARAIQSMMMPASTDILLLGHYCNTCSASMCGDLLKVKRFFGLQGYIITRQGAKKILDQKDIRWIGKQIDSVLSDLASDGIINIYATQEQLIVQDSSLPTTIQMVLKPSAGVDPWALD